MKKRTLTLIEIMIVILLITLIGGAIGYNVKGSLKKGKEFKTDRAIAQLEDIFELLMQEDDKWDGKKIADDPLEALKASGLAKDPEKMLKDGNNQDFIITYNAHTKKLSVRAP